MAQKVQTTATSVTCAEGWSLSLTWDTTPISGAAAASPAAIYSVTVTNNSARSITLSALYKGSPFSLTVAAGASQTWSSPAAAASAAGDLTAIGVS